MGTIGHPKEAQKKVTFSTRWWDKAIVFELFWFSSGLVSDFAQLCEMHFFIVTQRALELQVTSGKVCAS